MTVTTLRGDCRAILPTLPAGSFQTCVTSPPYYGLRSYLPDDHPEKHIEIGSEPTPEAYVAALVDVFREVRRALRDDGTLWLNLGDSYVGTGGAMGQRITPSKDGWNNDVRNHARPARTAAKGRFGDAKPKDLLGIPWMVAFALRADGWYLRRDIIWSKPNPMPESVKDRPTSSHEYLFLLSKQPSYFYDAQAIAEDGVIPAGTKGAKGSAARAAQPGVNARPPEYKVYSGKRNARSVWQIATQPYPGAHFATMPRALAERCILAGTSERGACPHCGAPWARVVDKKLVPTAKVSWGTRPDARDAAGRGQDQGSNRVRAGHVPGMAVDATTTGWAPSCACPAHTPIPCAVLDPFGGAGTTALVADRTRRDATIIDLNPEYREMAKDRVQRDAPLLAVVA